MPLLLGCTICNLTTRRASHSCPSMHHQLLLWAQGCTELALVVFLFSLPLKTPSNAYQRINSELGVSAAGSNLVHVSSTHPPSLTGRRAHFKQIQ